MMPDAWRLQFWKMLLRIRPAQLGDWIKQALRVRRMEAADRSGHRFWIDPCSNFGLHLLEEGVYEQNLTRITVGLIRDGDVYVDVGANEGYFSVLAASRGPSVRVLAIEPQSRLQAVIRRNLELNGCKNVQLVRSALSDSAGTVDLYLRPSGNTGASSLFPHWRLGRIHEAVTCDTLDAVLGRHAFGDIRLVKIDCEGAEHLVIRGASSMLAERRAAFVALEYHRSILGAAECRATDQKMREAGYLLSFCLGVGVYHLPGRERDLFGIGATEVDRPFE
jgi:FkbM family methyltransferase